MNIQDLRKESHLSASSCSDYSECGLQYRFGRIECLKAEFSPDSMLFGSAIHSVLQTFYLELLTGIKLPLIDLHEEFASIWKNMTEIKDNIQYSSGKDYHILLLEGKELLTVYYLSLPEQEYTILGVEEPFSFKVENVPVPVIGVMDLIIQDESGSITIIDHKTSARSFSQDEVDRNFQMSMYNLAARKCGYADSEIKLRFDILIKTKIKKFQSMYTTRTEVDDKRTTKLIQTVWKGITKEIFTPNTNSWRCKTCQFRQACDNWLLTDAA